MSVAFGFQQQGSPFRELAYITERHDGGVAILGKFLVPCSEIVFRDV
jgi:hypothetical protein